MALFVLILILMQFVQPIFTKEWKIARINILKNEFFGRKKCENIQMVHRLFPGIVNLAQSHEYWISTNQ